MQSSVSIGLGRNFLDSSASNSTPNYSDFIWCSPNSSSGGSVVGVSDENNYSSHEYNYLSLGNRNELQVSPQSATSTSHSYYDFLPHQHHHLHHTLNVSSSQTGANGLHSIGSHSHSNHRSTTTTAIPHYGGSYGPESEECCLAPEYYVACARSPADSTYETWNCHSSSLNHDGTSVGHSSPEDPLLISPNDEDGSVGVDGGGGDGAGSVDMCEDPGGNGIMPRPPRRRNTANKKERRRTMSINNAFADLRDCIPNVPADTKLSKIKTLRLATSYIAYLSEVLSGDDPSRTPAAFTAEISRKMARGDEKRRKELLMAELNNANYNKSDSHSSSSSSSIHSDHQNHRKTKGRTGWPQHVWALELQQ